MGRVNNKRHICIIGAGWYGCHAARYLKSKGVNVTLLDREGIFSGTSSKNQNRLHLGYHYPRSDNTINECVNGFNKFISEYGYCVGSFYNNFYLIHNESKVTVEEYKKKFVELDTCDEDIRILGMKVNNLESTIFRVKERFIDNQMVKSRMNDELKDYIEICDSPVITIATEQDAICVNGIDYDYVLNCTNNQYIPIPIPYTPIYENYCTLLYKFDFTSPTAITVMDGSFFSIFPYNLTEKIYTVTHVLYGVLTREKKFTYYRNSLDISSIKSNIENELLKVFPNLKEKYEYIDYFVSAKTKYDLINDDRSVRIHNSGRYYTFSGGKITGIFEMDPILEKLSP